MNEKQVIKIVGAVLLTALVVVGIKVLVNHIYAPEGGHGEMAAKTEATHEAAPMAEPAAEPMAEAGEEAAEGAPAPAEEEAAAPAPAPAEEAAAPAAEEAAAPAAAAAGDPAAGKKVFQAHLCFACHSFEPGKNGAGPSLAGVFGHKAGEVEGFDFSDALKSADVTVDAAFLDIWLQNPQEAVPGTKMVLAKPVKDATDRANLIAYIEEASAK